jgi:6-phosphogluconate dehydrogenase
VAKLLHDGHSVVVFDVDQAAIDACVALGAIAATSREDLVAKLGSAPVLWLMIPADCVETEVQSYLNLLPSGSVLIDGGNSNFHDTKRRAADAQMKSIHYIDVGTSGGVLGLTHGFCLMVGGDKEPANGLAPIFDTMVSPAGAWAYVGSSGSGHYVKMVHNGIEYALMQSYAEGYDLLKYGEVKGLDLAAIATVWQGGSIIQSQLNGLIAEVLHENPELDGIEGYVADSGEGRWTYEAAEAADVAMPALREAIAVRTASQQGYHIFATKLLAGLRNKFGGHAINNGEGKQ